MDFFQEYEHDRGLRLRFEEAAANELQQGWDRSKKKKTSAELQRQEAEIEDILNRPRVMEEGRPSSTLHRRRVSLEPVGYSEDVELKNTAAVSR